MKILVCVSIDSLWVLVLSVLNWEGKDGKVRVGLIILKISFQPNVVYYFAEASR